MSHRPGKARRISARLPATAYRLVEEAAALTGKNISQVLEQSIETFHRTLAPARPEPWKALRQSGFIASGIAPSSLSSNYKTLLTHSLKQKPLARKS